MAAIPWQDERFNRTIRGNRNIIEHIDVVEILLLNTANLIIVRIGPDGHYYACHVDRCQFPSRPENSQFSAGR